MLTSPGFSFKEANLLTSKVVIDTADCTGFDLFLLIFFLGTDKECLL